jgi:catechol 2,3-dioxygenase-like lactoylglutathione lyase family enzyme
MPQSLAHVTFLVRDYEEALAFFIESLGFRLVEDSPLPGDKRWLVVAPPGSRGASLLLAQAATPEQLQEVGNQAAGRVFLFLHTDDFWRDYRLMQAASVKFIEQPRQESYGTVAVFEDLYGNKWDLLQPDDNVPARPLPEASP